MRAYLSMVKMLTWDPFVSSSYLLVRSTSDTSFQDDLDSVASSEMIILKQQGVLQPTRWLIAPLRGTAAHTASEVN